MSSRRRYTHADYKVAWTCPLEVELIAAQEMLDEEHESLPQPPADTNCYHLGRIYGHNVIIAGMFSPGNTAAATVVAQMRMTFPNLRYGLLVGIGGGVSDMSEQGQIALGDIVVSKPCGIHSGAIQYDRGKAKAGCFERTGSLAMPPSALLNAAQALAVRRARADVDPLWSSVFRLDLSRQGLKRFNHPGLKHDRLFCSEYVHRKPGRLCIDECDVAKIQDTSPDRQHLQDYKRRDIVVHRGTIASGELVIKDALLRDHLARQNNLLCFETEAAGVLTDFPCLVIRGIADYCDSHKNDLWHGWAALTAAAYARELFFHLPKEEDRASPPLPNTGANSMTEQTPPLCSKAPIKIPATSSSKWPKNLTTDIIERPSFNKSSPLTTQPPAPKDPSLGNKTTSTQPVDMEARFAQTFPQSQAHINANPGQAALSLPQLPRYSNGAGKIFRLSTPGTTEVGDQQAPRLTSVFLAAHVDNKWAYCFQLYDSHHLWNRNLSPSALAPWSGFLLDIRKPDTQAGSEPALGFQSVRGRTNQGVSHFLRSRINYGAVFIFRNWGSHTKFARAYCHSGRHLQAEPSTYVTGCFDVAFQNRELYPRLPTSEIKMEDENNYLILIGEVIPEDVGLLMNIASQIMARVRSRDQNGAQNPGGAPSNSTSSKFVNAGPLWRSSVALWRVPT